MKTNVIEVNVNDITIGNRHRKDMGDIDALAKSIEEVGLLQPIGITPDYELVFGERRLRAYRDILGRDTIPARIVQVQSVLLGQIEENTMRKDFTPSELVAIVDSLRSYTHGGDRKSDQARKCDVETLTVDQAAKRAGLGGKDGYDRAKSVTEKGVAELIEAMDGGRLSLSAAAKLAEATPDEQRECLEKQLNVDRVTASLIQQNLSQIRNRKERERLLKRSVSIHDKEDSIQILHCPFQELEQSAELGLETVDLICTDIPYVKEFLPELEALGQFAARVLKPSGLFVTYCGQFWVHKALDAFGKHLSYRWMNASYWEGAATPVHVGGWAHPHARVLSQWKPILIFSKGEFARKGQWCDLSKVTQKEKTWHPWQQPLPEVEKLVRDFSQPGELVVDPCGGGFTTAIACLHLNRRFIGCDIDKAAVIKGQQRLAQDVAATEAA